MRILTKKLSVVSKAILVIIAIVITASLLRQDKAEAQGVFYITAAADNRVTSIPRSSVAQAYFPGGNLSSSEDFDGLSCNGTIPGSISHDPDPPIKVRINGILTQVYEYGHDFVNFYIPASTPTGGVTLLITDQFNIQYTKQFIVTSSSPMLVTHGAPNEYGLPHVAAVMRSDCISNCNGGNVQFDECNFGGSFLYIPKSYTTVAPDPRVLVASSNNGIWKDKWSVAATFGIAGFTPTTNNMQIIFSDLYNNVVATLTPFYVEPNSATFCFDYLSNTSLWPANSLNSIRYAKVRIKHLDTGKFSPYYIVKLQIDGGAEYLTYICSKP